MGDYSEALETVELFRGIEAADLGRMLSCIGAETKSVGRGEIVLLAGNRPRHVGIVLSGLLQVVREDYDGSRSLVVLAAPGEVFAEALCCTGVRENPVTVAADADSAIMLLDFTHILRICSNACAFHTKLIGNMLALIAKKSIMLQDHMEILSLKSLRARVLRYLKSFVPEQDRQIIIPLNREGLAEYLCAERSASPTNW